MGAIWSLLGVVSEQLPHDVGKVDDSLTSDPEVQVRKSSQLCVFCNVTKADGFDVVREDHEFIVFKDRDPAAAQHYLVIPRDHIANVKALQKSDVALVQRMADIANLSLDDCGVPLHLRRLGFHIPPFNSIHHLHLHAHGLPYKSFLRRWKYIVAAGGRHHGKGFSWFVDVDQVMHILDHSQRVRVFPC